jgi:aminopeptidase-like protein
MLNIIRDLAPLNRVFCSSDYDTSIEYLHKAIPSTVHELRAQDEIAGWVIPPKWDVEESYVLHDGKVLIDGRKSALSTIAYSAPFAGMVSGAELKNHVYCSRNNPERTVFHFRNSYRPWAREWGFSTTRSVFDSIRDEGMYRVCIKTREKEGYLKVLESHAGDPNSELRIVFVAHLDHPGMANDDLAGVATGIELMKRLAKKPLKYSYTLLCVQEMIGSQLFLNKFAKARGFTEGMFLEMPGTGTPLLLQGSFAGNSILEALAQSHMDSEKIPYRKGEFMSIVGNDEAVFESFGIPMSSLSRFPYPEYHTDLDTAELMDPGRLQEYVDILESTVNGIESGAAYRKKFQGVACLSNPAYGMYIDSGQPAFGIAPGAGTMAMRGIMERIPVMKGLIHAAQLHSHFPSAPIAAISHYLNEYERHGLLEKI